MSSILTTILASLPYIVAGASALVNFLPPAVTAGPWGQIFIQVLHALALNFSIKQTGLHELLPDDHPDRPK
jgi:hypothetical protein